MTHLERQDGDRLLKEMPPMCGQMPEAPAAKPARAPLIGIGATAAWVDLFRRDRA